MDKNIKDGAMCLITFSNNADHQNVVYSMFNALYPKYNVYTVGIKNPKSLVAAHTDHNFYVDCPLRPGIEKDTFKFGVLLSIARFIKEKNVKYLYFESLHIWNVFLMMLCRNTIRIEAIHDVIPHDDNKGMYLCNFVTSQLADRIILRNYKFKDTLAKLYHVSPKKITCMELWRSYPPEEPLTHSKKFLFFGRIRPYKGIDVLEKIIKRTPEISYVIVGEPDAATKSILERIKLLKNTEVCDTEVTDEKMRGYFKESDWVVLPYKDATQSGVIVDAYSYSRPVIAFDVGALAEQMVDGKTGYLISKGDIDEFIQAIKKANDMCSEQTMNFAHSAYVYGRKKYSAEECAEHFLALVKEIC